MTQIIRLKKANGIQLRQAAHHADLINMPNQVYGLANAYYASVPSPMQEAILRKALVAAGINFLKVSEQVTPAGEADRFDKVLQVALKNMVKAVNYNLEHHTMVEVRAAGHILYAVVRPQSEDMDLAWAAKEVVKGAGFSQTAKLTWNKVVRIKRKSFVAVVEVIDGAVQVSVFQGA